MEFYEPNKLIKNSNRFLLPLFLAFIGLVFGAISQLDALYFPADELGIAEIALRILFAFVGTPAFFLILQRGMRRIVLSLPPQVSERYTRYDTFTYLVFLFPMLGVSEFHLTPLVAYFVAFLFLASQFSLITLLLGKNRGDFFRSFWLVPTAFHISGFCALIYQVVWQRVLFTEFGVNIESITIVVAVFMFGLGLGSLLGGHLSKKYPSKLPHLFMTCEVLTGFFGLVSLQLIRFVSQFSTKGSLLSTSQVIFALLFIPTLLMGATLPLLVTFLYRKYRNVGESVGVLYFINTLGAAIGCFVTTDVLFALFGKQSTVYIAASGNFIIGLLIYKYTRNNKMESTGATETVVMQDSNRSCKNNFILVLFLSCVTGYVSLSQEILWFRAISYISGGKPVIFGHVLGIFLFGIAFGALVGKKVCLLGKNISLSYIATMLTVSSVLYYFSMPLIGRCTIVSEASGMLAAYALVGVVSFLMGGIFPVLCHEGITSKASVGLSMSWIYFANIIGATAGPLITGFVLLDLYPLEEIVLYLSVFTLFLAAAVFSVAPLPVFRKAVIALVIVFLTMEMSSIYENIYSGLLEKFQFKNSYRQTRRYKYLIENRSGIIAVEPGIVDTIYGGGLYDGKFTTDPVKDTNMINRAYMIAAVHPEPADVLEIGLSSGSWAKAISSYSKLKSLTVVEINPGYIGLIKKYPAISSILKDPRMNIVVNDGRRWLNSNADAKFDMIVMNTTYHWRDGLTNLLSEEFHLLCKKHLKKGGVLYFNTTGSENTVYTAAKSFKYIVRYSNFVAASDSPFSMTKPQVRCNMLNFQENGVPILAKDSSTRILDNLVSSDLSDKGNAIRYKKHLRVITDDNMATEFRKIVAW